MEYKKNEDGTDFLDENGEKVPIEVTDDKKETAKVIGNLVEELKESRLKLATAENLLKANAEKKPEGETKPLTDDEKLDLAITKKLAEKSASDAQANKKAAFEKFVTENKEFHPDNDPTGLRRDALQKKVNQFNTEGLQTVEQFLSVIGDAKKLLLGSDTEVYTSTRKNLDSFPTPKPDPAGRQPEVLNPKELKLAAMPGNTKEKILKLKAKNPDYLAELLKYVRD